MTLIKEELTARGFPRDSVIWSPSMLFLCNSGHLGYGCLLTLVAVLAWGHWVALLFFPAIAFKELVIDVWIEYPQVNRDAFVGEAWDLAWYWPGSIIGHLLAWWLSP